MTPIPQDPPLRTFNIILKSDPIQQLDAHAARVDESGALEVLVYVGGMLWTKRAYARGVWTGYSADVPTREQVQAIQDMNDAADDEVRRRIHAVHGKPGQIVPLH